MTSLILFKSNVQEIFELSFLEAFPLSGNFEIELWHMLQNKVQVNNKQTNKKNQNTKYTNTHKTPEFFKVFSNCHERAVETQEENKPM